jgi:hypothetical protein
MPVNSPNQGIPEQQGADAANLPLAQVAWDGVMENRLVQRYASIADRTARNAAPNEGELSHLADVDRYEGYNGASWISLYKRSLWALIRKTADQFVISTTTLTNDTEFLVALPTAGIFQWRHLVFADGAATSDIRFAYTMPAGATMRWGGIGPSTAVAAGVGTSSFLTQTGSGSSLLFGTSAVNTIETFMLEGEITMGGTAGNLQFQFTQDSSVASNTTIRARSRLEIWQFS